MMPKATKTHTWRGQQLTAEQIAKLEGKRLSIVQTWLRANLEQPPLAGYQFDGELMTVQEIADKYHITQSRAYQWIKNGYTTAPAIRHRKTYLWDGEMLTAPQIAERIGTTPHYAMNYLRPSNRKYTTEEVMRLRVHYQTPQPYTWNGITYPSIYSASKQLGLPRWALLKRLEKGWTCDADVVKDEITWNESIIRKPQQLEFNGMIFSNYADMAAHYQISEATARRYIKRKQSQPIIVEPASSH